MQKKRYAKKNQQQMKIAQERINFLFREAKKCFKHDAKKSDYYVKIARRTAMKYKIRLDSSLKKQFCKKCLNFLVPGANCRVRIHKSRLIYYCNSCKNVMRHPIK